MSDNDEALAHIDELMIAIKEYMAFIATGMQREDYTAGERLIDAMANMSEYRAKHISCYVNAEPIDDTKERA